MTDVGYRYTADDLKDVLDAEVEQPTSDAPMDAVDGDAPRKSQATRLVELAEHLELFHADDKAYAVVSVDGHVETWPLRSKRFRDYLDWQYYLAERRAPSAQATEDALRTLCGKALFECPEAKVYRRIAEHDGHIYIDLCDSQWRVIEVTQDGWRVITDSPVRFIRAHGMKELPVPKSGSIATLWRYLNVSDQDTRRLITAWLVAALRPTGPYPALVLQGEQGTGKSTVVR